MPTKNIYWGCKMKHGKIFQGLKNFKEKWGKKPGDQKSHQENLKEMSRKT